MPRTKRNRAPGIPKTILTSIKQEHNPDKIESLLQMAEHDVNTVLTEFESSYRKLVSAIKTSTLEELSKYPVKDRSKTISQLDYKVNVSNATFLSSMSILNEFNSTNMTLFSSTGIKKKNITDEGYVTTESNRSTSSTRAKQRTCRARARDTPAANSYSKRLSRSLSRSKMNKTVTLKSPPGTARKTPAERRMLPPNSFGYITPKVKPNTPLTILRRPKQGEMAVSMQGSPLLVNGFTDHCANVNIPLGDGSMLSLQPQRGLRLSRFPELDANTQRQLETLRDNLDKVCQIAYKKGNK